MLELLHFYPFMLEGIQKESRLLGDCSPCITCCVDVLEAGKAGECFKFALGSRVRKNWSITVGYPLLLKKNFGQAERIHCFFLLAPNIVQKFSICYNYVCHHGVRWL